MVRRNIDWSLHGDEIVLLYVSGLSTREVAERMQERHGVTYPSGTLRHFLGLRGVLRNQREGRALAINKATRICEVCNKPHIPTSWNQRWCAECTRVRKYTRRVTAHGLPAILIETAFERQGKRCAICSKPFNDLFNTKDKKTLFIDHDHSTNQFRGLLCVRCNNGMSFIDDATWFASAKKYVEDAISCEQPVFVNPQRVRKYVRNVPANV